MFLNFSEMTGQQQSNNVPLDFKIILCQFSCSEM